MKWKWQSVHSFALQRVLQPQIRSKEPHYQATSWQNNYNVSEAGYYLPTYYQLRPCARCAAAEWCSPQFPSNRSHAHSHRDRTDHFILAIAYECMGSSRKHLSQTTISDRRTIYTISTTKVFCWLWLRRTPTSSQSNTYNETLWLGIICFSHPASAIRTDERALAPRTHQSNPTYKEIPFSISVIIIIVIISSMSSPVWWRPTGGALQADEHILVSGSGASPWHFISNGTHKNSVQPTGDLPVRVCVCVHQSGSLLVSPAVSNSTVSNCNRKTIILLVALSVSLFRTFLN